MLTIPLLLVLAGAPAPLRCLERHYPVRAVEAGGAWALTLPDGRRLPWDDGRAKDLEERLADPDLEDVFAIPYPRGPIEPVVELDRDPGRVRVTALLAAAYPRAGLRTVRFLGRPLRVHARVAGALGRVEARLEDPALRALALPLGGGHADRNIAGTDRRSAHAFGIAVDINPARGDYWRWQRPRAPVRWRNRVPAALVAAFEAEGFIWGGRWYHYDTMHFEYRPELLDPACDGRAALSGASGMLAAR